MRINFEREAERAAASPDGPRTRGERSHANAVKRLKARHAERDAIGRPIIDGKEAKDVLPTVSQAKGGVRLDAWLVAHGHAASREKAKALIESGAVRVSNVSKPKGSTVVLERTRVEVDARAGAGGAQGGQDG